MCVCVCVCARIRPLVYYSTVSNIVCLQDFHRRVVPVGGLDEVVVEDKLMEQLREIVQFEKAR